MQTPAEIKAEIEKIANEAAQKLEELNKQLDAVQQASKQDAIDKAKAIIKDYKLTISDLGLKPFKEKNKSSKKDSALKGRKVPPKVIDPKTGKRWSGRGTKPQWVSDMEAKKASSTQASLV